jgi:hypothetical protein
MDDLYRKLVEEVDALEQTKANLEEVWEYFLGFSVTTNMLSS